MDYLWKCGYQRKEVDHWPLSKKDKEVGRLIISGKANQGVTSKLYTTAIGKVLPNHLHQSTSLPHNEEIGPPQNVNIGRIGNIGNI